MMEERGKMKIELHEITVGELVEGYEDNEELGVRGYGGRLDIRPAYQREFIYKEQQRNAVVNTVMNGFPLNVMYWAVRDGGQEVPYEVLDGQQRTISLCQYAMGDFSFKGKYFANLTDDEKERFLAYRLMIYLCSGTDSEKLDWFKTINISGEKLTAQELRNAVYAGEFTADAKRYFSKNGCAAYQIGKALVNGVPIRQDYLETAIKWKCLAEGKKDDDAAICNYMGLHQHDANAVPLWNHFRTVVNWAESYFTIKGREKVVKGIDWGRLYCEYGDKPLDRDAMDAEIHRLIMDSEVQKKSGIIPYVLSGDERMLGLRAFPDDIKMAVYERQNHRCNICGKEFDYSEMEGDHIKPWREGGRTVEENCQMLCRDCNRKKGGK